MNTRTVVLAAGGRRAKIKEFWDTHGAKFPRLQRLAWQILCISASSAPSERVFSQAGFIINERRTCMNPELVSAIQKVSSIIKYNADFYEGQVKEMKSACRRARRRADRSRGGHRAESVESLD